MRTTSSSKAYSRETEHNDLRSRISNWADGLCAIEGLLSKTTFVLSVAQNAFTRDNSCQVDFLEFIEEQVREVALNDRTLAVGGIGFWPVYRARTAGVRTQYESLTRHYFIDDLSSRFGRGDYDQLVENPGFEEEVDLAGGFELPGVWYIDGASLNSIRRRNYANIPGDPPVPQGHGCEDVNCEDCCLVGSDPNDPEGHGRWCLYMQRGASSNRAWQVLELDPGFDYSLSAWVFSRPGAGIRIKAVAEDTGEELARNDCDETTWDYFQPRYQDQFRYAGVTFRVPGNSPRVRVVLSDYPGETDAETVWDFVELHRLPPAWEGTTENPNPCGFKWP